MGAQVAPRYVEAVLARDGSCALVLVDLGGNVEAEVGNDNLGGCNLNGEVSALLLGDLLARARVEQLAGLLDDIGKLRLRRPQTRLQRAVALLNVVLVRASGGRRGRVGPAARACLGVLEAALKSALSNA